MLIRILFLGIAALISIFIANQLIKYFSQRKIDKLWNDDEPVEIQEKKVIKLAAKAGGKITLPEICMHTNLSVNQAQNVLEMLLEKQVFAIQLTDSGSKVYALADLASDNDKQNAIDLV